MPTVMQAQEFFVVGGPVQPDRPCYVERAADAELMAGIKAQRFCYVLAPPGTGKSSLMGRAVRALRRDGGLAAAVDLAQIDARGESADPDRWFYGIAHRVVHELRLETDLPSWWREKTALPPERRLAAFFWDVVLTNTTAPVTIFLDDIERTRDLPFAAELFGAIRACYARRRSESDYARLNFVALGVASVERLGPDPKRSPFADGQAIELGDFSDAEAYQLAAGFGGERIQAQALMDRIYVWTGGHPYLTQKVARGVARKDGRLEDVERVVKEQLLRLDPPEPLLGHARALLAGGSAAQLGARKYLRKLASGAAVPAVEGDGALELLRLAGVVSVGRDRKIRYRNRVFKEAFGARWLDATRPAGLRIALAATVAVAAIAGGALWYFAYLPRPYLETLTAPSEDFAAVEEAYEKLRGLPGFAARADRLFTAALASRGVRATRLEDVAATGDALTDALGRDDIAEQLRVDFWLREAQRAMNAERRDDALLYALQALPDESARALLAELIDADYPLLQRSREWPTAPDEIAVDWPRLRALGIDAAQRLQWFDLEASGVEGPTEPEPFSVLEYRPLVREIRVGRSGSAGEFELTVAVRHPATAELSLTLTAPSGTRASLALPQSADLEFSFTASGSSPLAALADAEREGVWRLALIDTRAANAGTLLDWALDFKAPEEEPWRDARSGGVAIPDPERSTSIVAEITAGGRYALVRPATPGAVGTLAIWNLRDAQLSTDLQLPAAADYAAVNADGTRLVVAAGNALTLWNIADGRAVARLSSESGFVLPPALSTDGEYLMIAERVDGAAPLFSLVRVETGELLTSHEGVDGVASWMLGPGARYVVLLGDELRAVRLVDPRRGTEIARLSHPRALRRITPLTTEALLTVDAVGDIRVWEIGAELATTTVGSTVEPRTLSIADGGNRIAYAAPGGYVEVRDVADPRNVWTLRAESATTQTRLSPDGSSLLTGAGSTFRFWRLPAPGTPSGDEPRSAPMLELSSIALDRASDDVALGFRGGYVRAGFVAGIASSALAAHGLDYFGHRGAVESLAVDAAQGLMASGGRDGVIRVWDLAGVPTERAIRDVGGAVAAVELSADGRSIVAAIGTAVHSWRAIDGTHESEVRLDARALALDLSADDRRLVVGDERGRVALFDAGSGARSAEPLELARPIRFVGFGADERVFVATEHWLHGVDVEANRLSIAGSRLLPIGIEAAAVRPDGATIRLVGGRGTELLRFEDVTIDSRRIAPLAPDAAELMRDWEAVLGRRVDPDGRIEQIAL